MSTQQRNIVKPGGYLLFLASSSLSLARFSACRSWWIPWDWLVILCPWSVGTGNEEESFMLPLQGLPRFFSCCVNMKCAQFEPTELAEARWKIGEENWKVAARKLCPDWFREALPFRLIYTGPWKCFDLVTLGSKCFNMLTSSLSIIYVKFCLRTEIKGPAIPKQKPIQTASKLFHICCLRSTSLMHRLHRVQCAYWAWFWFQHNLGFFSKCIWTTALQVEISNAATIMQKYTVLLAYIWRWGCLYYLDTLGYHWNTFFPCSSEVSI